MTRYRDVGLLVALLLAMAPPLAAQRHEDTSSDRSTMRTSDDDEGATIDTTIPFATTGGVVDLSVLSGEITVTGWTRGEARVHVTTDEDTPVHFEHGPDRILLDARRGGRHHHHDDGGDGDVQYDLTVPTGTRVLMHSVSGDLHARGTHGELEARSVNGDIEADDVVRTAIVE